MLILSRHNNESILIGEEVSVTVFDIDRENQKVIFAIDAPREIPVDRSEVRERKRQLAKKIKR